MVVQEEGIRPVMVGLGYFTDQLNVPWGEVMAYLTIITVPVSILLFSHCNVCSSHLLRRPG